MSGIKEILRLAFSLEEESVTAEERDLAERIAKKIAARGMVEPSILFFESMRPLTFIGSQVAIGLTPLADMFVNPQEYRSFVKLLEKRKGSEEFVRILESLREQK